MSSLLVELKLWYSGSLWFSKPVAITVTITSSFRFSLITAPNIVLISVLAAVLITSAASSTSNNVSEAPPVTFIIASVAPLLMFQVVVKIQLV